METLVEAFGLAVVVYRASKTPPSQTYTQLNISDDERAFALDDLMSPADDDRFEKDDASPADTGKPGHN